MDAFHLPSPLGVTVNATFSVCVEPGVYRLPTTAAVGLGRRCCFGTVRAAAHPPRYVCWDSTPAFYALRVWRCVGCEYTTPVSAFRTVA